MRKGRDLLGIPITEVISGQRLGEVLDLVIDSENNAVSGFLIDKGNWLRSPKQVSVQSVQQVNADEIKVQNSYLCLVSQTERLASQLCGKRVMTVGGQIIGSIQDIVLNESGFTIDGFEISDGLISDLISGRAIIEQPSIVTQSEYAVVVNDQLAMIRDNQS